MTNGVSTAFTALDEIAPRCGAAVMLEVLRSEGVRYIFGSPGTTELPLIDAPAGVRDMAYILGWGMPAAVGVSLGLGREPVVSVLGFLALAAAMGIASRRMDRAADIAGAVADGIASGRPNLIELPLSAG
jgi:thiamine pyrophosphate-dependent acetolactate synthase large subunit-like protein